MLVLMSCSSFLNLKKDLKIRKYTSIKIWRKINTLFYWHMFTSIYSLEGGLCKPKQYFPNLIWIFFCFNFTRLSSREIVWHFVTDYPKLCSQNISRIQRLCKCWLLIETPYIFRSFGFKLIEGAIVRYKMTLRLVCGFSKSLDKGKFFNLPKVIKWCHKEENCHINWMFWFIFW